MKRMLAALALLLAIAPSTAQNINLNQIQTQPGNTIVGNTLVGAGRLVSIIAPSCSSASSALTWTSNLGFTCNTAVAASTAATLATPRTINGTSFNGSANIQTSIAGSSDYANTTWTPVDNSGAGLTLASVSASYTKIGNMIYAYAQFDYPATADGSAASIGGFPVASANANYGNTPCVLVSNSSTGVKVAMVKATTAASVYHANLSAATNTDMSSSTNKLVCVYPAS